MLIFQYWLYLWVLLPRKGNEGQRGGLQVIRGSQRGKHFWPAVPWLSRGTLYSRCGGWHTPNPIVKFRQMVPGRDIWDSTWTRERTQECQDPTTSRNILGPPRKIQSIRRTLLDSSYNFIMMLLIHTDVDIRILLFQGLSEKISSSFYPTSWGIYFTTCTGPVFWGGTSWVFHCVQERCNYVGHAP